jgi:uncharacterized RDD family membrane protein YckC
LAKQKVLSRWTHRYTKSAKKFLHVKYFSEFSGLKPICSNLLTNLNDMETIKTTEHNEIEYAGFWLRFAAYIIDNLILGVLGFIIAIPAIVIIVSIAVGLENISEPEDLLMNGNLLKAGMIAGIVILVSLFSLVTGWLYYALFESSKHGGTLGKMAVGIKVTTIDGERITFGRATGRYFARIVSNLTIYIGYIMAGFTEKKQALHDILANCIVIKK